MTQKPIALLERIISVSSNRGDTILDPFCGCGTTIEAAHNLDRRWIGIDITQLAISLIKYRLAERAGEPNVRVIGEPTVLEEAEALAASDQYQFQWWALHLVNARPADEKKGADKGIDGILRFNDEPNNKDAKHKTVIISVKAGKVTVSQVRDLVGVLDREKAAVGVLISFNEPTYPMRQEAADAGYYNGPWGQYPRVQLLTVAELMSGKKLDIPQTQGMNTTLPSTPKKKGKEEPGQLAVFDD